MDDDEERERFRLGGFGQIGKRSSTANMLTPLSEAERPLRPLQNAQAIIMPSV